VSHSEDHEGIKKALTAGFFFNAAKLQRSGNYRTIKNKQTVHMHPQNGLSEVRAPPNTLMPSLTPKLGNGLTWHQVCAHICRSCGTSLSVSLYLLRSRHAAGSWSDVLK